jgi:threonine/homoserine/homoserine lactone efflux protein
MLTDIAPGLAGFLWTSLLIELTPGPNMTTLAILAATHGRRAGFAAVAGVALGLLLVGLAAALGLATVLSNSPVLYQTLRWAGVLYLLYLAWEGWHGISDISGQPAPEHDDGKFFTQGLMTNLLNPKAALFYISILPVFIVSTKPVIPQSLVLTATYVAVASVVHTAIVLLAAKMGRLFAGTSLSQTVARVLSAALVGVALWLVWTTRAPG